MHEGRKTDAETDGRRFGQGPDTCRVAVGATHYGNLQTVWLGASIHNGPGAPSLESGWWHRSYVKYGAEFGRFLKSHACPKFLNALRKELQDA